MQSYPILRTLHKSAFSGYLFLHATVNSGIILINYHFEERKKHAFFYS